jgi:hypothetical protein
LEGLAIGLEFRSPVVERNLTLGGEFHEGFKRGLAEFGGKTEGDFVFAKKLEREKAGGIRRGVGRLQLSGFDEGLCSTCRTFMVLT